MSEATRTRAEMAKALKLRQDIIERFGAAAIAEAETRLCRSCRFDNGQTTFLCELNAILLPITSEGEDCPYHVPKTFGADATSTGPR